MYAPCAKIRYFTVSSPVLFAAAYACLPGGTVTNLTVTADLNNDITGCTLEGSLQFTTAATSLPASPQYALAKRFTLRNSFTAANGGPSPRTYIRFTGPPAKDPTDAAAAIAAGEGGAGPVTILVENNDLTSRCFVIDGAFPVNSNITFSRNKMRITDGRWSYAQYTLTDPGGVTFWDILFFILMKGSVLTITDNTCAQTRALGDSGHIDLIEWIGVRLLPGALHVAARNEWSFRVIGDDANNPAAAVNCNVYMFLGIKNGLTITGPDAVLLIEDNVADVLSVQQALRGGPANIFRCDGCVVDGGGVGANSAILAVRRTVVRNFIVMGKPFASVVSLFSLFTLANGGIFELSGTIGVGGAGAIIRSASIAGVIVSHDTNSKLIVSGDGCRFIVANNTFAEVRAGGTAAAAGGWGTGGADSTTFINWQSVTVIGGGSAVPTDALFLVTGNVVRLTRPPTASDGTAIRLVVDTVNTPSTPTALFGDPTALSEAQRAVAMASSPYSSSPASSLGAHHGTRVSVAVVENIVVYAGPLPAAGAAFADTPPLLYIDATAAGAPAP